MDPPSGYIYLYVIGIFFKIFYFYLTFFYVPLHNQILDPPLTTISKFDRTYFQKDFIFYIFEHHSDK